MCVCAGLQRPPDEGSVERRPVPALLPRLVLGATREPEPTAQTHQTARGRLRRIQPEKRVVLDSRLPERLGSAVRRQTEAQQAVVVLRLRKKGWLTGWAGRGGRHRHHAEFVRLEKIDNWTHPDGH